MPRTSGLEDHLGYWLRFVSNHVSHAFALKVEARGVTVAEWVLLRHLAESGEVHPSTLAENIGMSRGAISKLVDRLEEKGLLRRKAHKDDRRFQSVSLSAAGAKLVPVLAALADANDREFFGHLGRLERESMTRILREIVQCRGLRVLPID